MQGFRYIAIGILFGITMIKSGAASWFRINEMFHFESFHMFGIMGSAALCGILLTLAIKKYQIKSFSGEEVIIADKVKSVPRYLFGGILFGLGWGIIGLCPGPIFTLLGAGYFPLLLVLVSAVIGTYSYGYLKRYLPH